MTLSTTRPSSVKPSLTPTPSMNARRARRAFRLSGRVFPISEDAILCDAFTIPKDWFQINGMDFGWDHPFAATRNACG
jgi:hypothetical protein